MFQVNNKDTRTMSGAFEKILHLFRAFLLLTLKRKMFTSSCYEALERIKMNEDVINIGTKWVNFTCTAQKLSFPMRTS